MGPQSGGKIGVAGTTGGNRTPDFGGPRHGNDGPLEATFASGGIVVTSIGPNADFAHAVALQADGKIVAAGTDSAHFALARYGTDGALDATFGTGGVATTTFAGSSASAF